MTEEDFLAMLARGVPLPVARGASEELMSQLADATRARWMLAAEQERQYLKERARMRDEARTVDAALAQLIERVRACLSDDLLLAEQRRRERLTSSAGHCYVASEALWHLTGKTLAVRQLHHEGNSHWFLLDTSTGAVIDATADQFRTVPPYGEARRRNFLTREPSRRCGILLRRLETVSA